MILHALTQYYQRKAESDGGVAPEGFENKEIPFIIVIDKQGKFIQLEDTRELKNKKKVARTFLVPKGLGRSGSKSYEVSNLLWDHYGYVLAYAGEKGQEQADKQHASFTAKVNELKQVLPDEAGVTAVAAFLSSAEEKSKVMQATNWVECAKVKGCNLSFRLELANRLVTPPNVLVTSVGVVSPIVVVVERCVTFHIVVPSAREREVTHNVVGEIAYLVVVSQLQFEASIAVRV